MKKAFTTLAVATVIILSSTTAQAVSHTVQKGDTFWNVGKRYGITLESMLKANNANYQTYIYPGQKIEVPIGNTPIKTPITSINKRHTVAQGDTLWLLGQKYLVTPESIIQSNTGITENLTVGQVINIPQRYTVPITQTNGKYRGVHGLDHSKQNCTNRVNI